MEALERLVPFHAFITLGKGYGGGYSGRRIVLER